MFCKQCGNQIADAAVMCVKCGVPTGAAPVVQQQPQFVQSSLPPGAKSKQTYQLLAGVGGFLGFPGIHNLYAGYTGKGMAQLLISMLSCWILWLQMFIWAIVDLINETKDSTGNPLV